VTTLASVTHSGTRRMAHPDEQPVTRCGHKKSRCRMTCDTGYRIPDCARPGSDASRP